MNMNSISKRLSDLVESKKISTRRLEELTGIPKSAIQRYTSGTTDRIPVERLKLLANALGVTPGYLMGIETMEGSPINLGDPTEEEIQAIINLASRLPAHKLPLARSLLKALVDDHENN